MLLRNLKPVSNSQKGKDTVDIRIEEGVIKEIGSGLKAGKGEESHDFEGAFVSPGWMDMHVHLREPGFEHKETIKTGCDAAAFGGFTAVACMPNTKPATHTRDVVEYIIKKAEKLPVDVHPIACVTKERKGKSIAEMADLKEGGAVAFSDDGDPVYDSQVMRVALEYSSMLGLPIINHEEDLALSRPGHMNEGKVATRLGLDGTPGIAEEVMIARDIMLAEYTGGHIHVAHISTKGAVDLVRQAKKKGINVTTEVCAHHFDLTDEEIEKQHFDTNFKMHPPLRTQEDVDAMVEGLVDGTIDAICTDHAPHAIEEKEVEFIYAPNGIIGLETAWSITNQRLLQTKKLDLQQLMDKLVYNPRKILNLESPEIKEGAEANLTFFNTDEEWTFTPKNVRSKSKNSPYLHKQLKGRAVGIFNKGQLVINELR
ncbi:dihydroorotase [Gracilimonas sediminicola]|uniref:Dihydroorotase n=1 Tax=Gracilimonas sediminicola TaxID=2952158 RepID=A0A9X2L189_9BACT|nr:dihydroorotase [Gracilimonas sediminicola]MCP9290347.1 dihydroorotase [Gracilimonas sediminicola]